ncbi:MAG: hypothetical protein HPY59_15690 [Anaerolineae bacterium]|nr:hypothetical protein [Anaerolineae bacterium]
MNANPEANPSAIKCPQCGANLIPGAEEYSVCQYCGSSLVWQRGGAGSAEKAVRGMRLKLFSYTDTEVTGLELFHMLAPVGWQFQGGCRWLMDNPGMPAVVAFQLCNPQGQEAFEVLPNMNFTWTNNPFTGMMNPTGSRYFGAEVYQPVNIREAFLKFILPRYRSGVTGLQVISLEPQPELPRLVRSEAPLTPGGSAEGGKIRIRYTWNNLQYEEEIYGVVEVFRTFNPGMFGMTEADFWFIDYLFSFRAGAGKLDATADLFTVMIQSFQLNPHWYAAFKTIAQQLIQNQIQRIRNIGQIGQMYAQAGREMREQNLNDWYARHETYDRLSVDRSRAIRDVEGFMDPHREQVVELPAGYGHAWANDLGEYILTEDSSFNPNLTSGQNWQPMQQV